MGRLSCCDKIGVKKGPWTPAEDLKLKQYIQEHGPGNWRTLPKNAGLQRCGKSCRLRWINYLRPDIKRGRFSFEEEETIIQLHSVLGNKWSAIAARLPGRTDNEIKNYWNTHVRKRLLRMGIDPVTHSPRLDLLDLSSILSTAQLNLSNLIRLQTLKNPQLLLGIATNLLASNNVETENPVTLLQKLQENQCSSENQQFQSCNDQIRNPTQITNVGQFSTNITNLSSENLAENLPHSGLDQSLPNGSDTVIMSPSSAFQLLNNHQNLSFDSLMSTPMSSPTPLTSSSSAFINCGCAEDDERESYFSDLLKFEIPESLNFNGFM